ncbi:MAG: hypothetical protein KZQ83_04835 [gamma proteobacterium symbiont of Taylorina sp.]|nr:hypothetical protein [gamma proteobacterium symbiont of Taylorina sp.]
MKRYYLLLTLLLLSIFTITTQAAEKSIHKDYQHAQWDPIHFQPAIATASNEQCLGCHQEILDRQVLIKSPAGITAESTKAWYQTLTTYEGAQQTFHQRHLSSDFSNQVMNMQCITCHEGNNPREEAIIPPDQNQTQFTLRKSVNPETCLMCHGNFPDYVRMGLPSHWNESRDIFQNNCLLCHAGIRNNRHQVNFLKAEAIEKAGKENADVCFGCHGGRQWYRISYPYPRHAWEGMAKEIPDWAKERPTESHPRFQIPANKISKK